jgi:hypothetical protein
MLSDLRIRGLKPVVQDRWISDGNKLYLRVRKTGARSWVVRRRKQDGGNITLGSWPGMSLAQARVKAGGFTGKVVHDLTPPELYFDLTTHRHHHHLLPRRRIRHRRSPNLIPALNPMMRQLSWTKIH